MYKPDTWYARNREKALADAKAWREANPERYRENVNRWKRENRAKVALDNKLRQWRRHGIEITHEEYEKMVLEQDNRCKLCDKPQKNRKLAVDHCHDTGRVRGLLCSGCNYTLGFIERYLNNPDIKGRIDRYLEG